MLISFSSFTAYYIVLWAVSVAQSVSWPSYVFWGLPRIRKIPYSCNAILGALYGSL